jgi:rhodanese-related sulfurtransferase
MKRAIISAALVVAFAGCLENRIAPIETSPISTSAELLRYFEERGDYFNSLESPPFVEASEIYNDPDDYAVLDVRDEAAFTKGRIPGAARIEPSELATTLDTLDSFKKPVIVSATGHRAAYFATTLRLVGYRVFSLRFGMAAWHMDFASERLDGLGDDNPSQSFDNVAYPRHDYETPPNVAFPDPNASIDERARARAQALLEEGFETDPSDDRHTTTLDFAYDAYDYYTGERTGPYAVCYGSKSLYHLMGKDTEPDPPSHPPGTAWYQDKPASDFRSDRFLHALPNDEPFLVYDVSGESASALAAYLRMLGYDPRVVMFGAQSFLDAGIVSTFEGAFHEGIPQNYVYEFGAPVSGTE